MNPPALVLLDRDGVLNVDRPDSVRHPDELVLLPGAAAAVGRLTRAGVLTALCTNQSIVGRGVIDATMLDRIHAKLAEALAREGGRLDHIFVAPDAPDAATRRRKPGPGMIEDALAAVGAGAADTPFIGDALRDLQAAAAAGCPRHLVRTGKGAATLAAGLPDEVDPVQVHEDLAAAVDWLLGA